MEFDLLDRKEPAPKYTGIGDLNEKDRRNLYELWERVGLVAPEKDGVLTELKQGFHGAAIDTLRGVGSTLEETTGYSGMREYFDEVKARNRHLDPYEGYKAASLDPANIARTIGSGAAQSTLSLGAGIATTALTGGNAFAGGAAMTGVMFSQIYGDRVKEYREQMPNQDEGTIKGLAFASAVGESLIESVCGPEAIFNGIAKRWVTGALKETTKSFIKNVGKSAAIGYITEGSEEVAQDLWNRVCLYAGTENVTLPSWDEVKETFMGGAWSGLALGGFGGGVEHFASRNETNSQGVNQGAPQAPVAENPDASGRDAMEALYEEFGIPLSRMTKQEQQTEGIGKVGENETNGLYDKKTGEVKINPDNEGEVFSHGHEFDHWMTANHPDIAAALHKIMDEEVNDAGKALQTNPEELHADLLGNIINDPNVLFETANRLNEQQMGFGEKFLKSIIEFAQKAMAYLKQNPGLKGAREYFNNYKRVKNAAEDALIEIRKRQKQAEQNSKVENAELNADLSNKDGETGALKAENAENMQNPTVQSIPVSDLNIDPARFQFKSKANKKTGVDESNQIGGEWDEKTAGNLYVWEDKTGKKFVVNGHHRFALAKEKGVRNVNAIVDREADGVTAEQAKRNGTLINIRDEQGDIEDYAAFIRNEKMDEARAEKEGILKRKKGKLGFTIGRYASDNLYHIFRSGDMNAGTAATVAEIARGDEALEAAGIKAAKNGMSASQLREFMKLLKNTPKKNTGSAQGDLFGFDDSAIRQAETLSGLAAKHIRAVKEKINAAKGAVNNPEAAKKLGVTTKKNAQALLDNARKEEAEWENWHTNPKLYSQLMDEAGFTEKKTDEPETEGKQAEKPVVKENLTTEGRFDQNSDTPLLTPEEDSRDFQLIDETSEEAKAREAKAGRDEAARIERAKEEARRNAPDLPMESQNVGEIPAMTEDEYLGSMGLSMPLSDYMTDKQKIPHGETESQRKQRIREADRIANEYAESRKKAKAEYRRKIENGELREPTAIEKLEKVAAGNSDNESVQAARRALEKRRKKHEVPTNYKTFDKDGNWKLDRTLGELQDAYIAALNAGRHIRVETPKGNAHIMKDGDGFHVEGVDGKSRHWGDSAVREMLARFITSPNPRIKIAEESPTEHFADRKIQKDGSLLRVGDYAAFGKTKEHPALYTGTVVSIGSKNVKLKTQSQMYGEQVITLPWSDYKAHYPKSAVELSGEELNRFKDEHGGNTPEQFDQAKKSFMEQRLNREGRPEREITSAAGVRADARTNRDVESFVGDGKQYSKKKGEKESFYQKPFAEGLKRVVDPAQKDNRDSVYVRDTPKIFKEIGFTALPMMMNARHLRLNYFSRNEFESNFGKIKTQEHAHGLHNAMNDLPKALENPLAIVVNQTPNAKPGSVVAITDMNIGGKKVVVPILIEAENTADGQRIDSHLVLTVYDSGDWIKDFLIPAIKAEKTGIGIFYFDKEKANRYSALSKKEGSIPTGIAHNIAEAGINVKRQMETLQFKRWFGDSKAVDENGDPLVVYRGSEFDPLAQEVGKGIIKPEAYFTTDPEYARRYARNGGKVRAYFLNIRRPFDIRNPECLKDLKSIYPDHEFQRGKSGALDWGEASIVDGEFLKENFGDKYDGIIYDEGGDPTDNGLKHRGISYVPLNGGSQVKSATDNIGTFDPGDPDVRYSLKHHKQVNPIREAGPIRDEYQNKLDNAEYETRSDEEVTHLAEQRIKTFGGFDEVAKIIIEGDFKLNSDVGQRIVQLVLTSDEFKKLDVDQRDKIADVYIKNLGTEIARALAARRLGALNLNDIKSVQAHVNAFLAKIDKKNPLNKLREDCLKQFGFDIESLPDEILKDNNKLDELFRRLAAEKASVNDKLYEFWINSILSGPSTHIANIFGNTANAAYELGIKRFTEALINTVAKRKDGATFGEFKAMINALNWREAWRRAKFAYDFETLTTAGKLENVHAAISGKTGQLIRTPGRLLRAADEFARALIVPVESAAYAHRQAKSKGLSGESMRQFIEDQLKNEKSEASDWGRQRAIELTFQEDPGNAVKQLIRWRDSGGIFGNILKYTLPFMKTPTNILKQGVRKSIFGGYALANDVAQISRGKKNIDSKTIELAAEQLIAWGTLAMIYGMTSGDDDDEPILTGSSAPYGSSEQKFKAGKLPPYSIRIGDTWYSYQRIEPLATGLAFIADGLNALRSAKKGEDGTKIIKKLGYGAKQLIFDKSFLDSLGELNKIASDPERSVEKFVTRYISSWVPNVAKQVTSALMDDSIRDTKSRRNGLEWWEDQFQTVVNSMGIPVSAPKYDYLGREIRKDDLEGAWRLARLIPIRRITPEKEPVDQLFMNYNNKVDNADEYYPGIPSFRFVRNGEKLYFSGENYAEFSRRSGELARKQINNAFRHGLLHKDNPTKRDIDLIKKIFRRARKQVREDMYRAKKFNR